MTSKWTHGYYSFSFYHSFSKGTLERSRIIEVGRKLYIFAEETGYLFKCYVLQNNRWELISTENLNMMSGNRSFVEVRNRYIVDFTGKNGFNFNKVSMLDTA